jgi:hypothetical protein
VNYTFGLDPDDFNLQVFDMGFVARTDDEAWDTALEGVRYWQAFYRTRNWIAWGNTPVPALPDLKAYRHATGFGASAVALPQRRAVRPLETHRKRDETRC